MQVMRSTTDILSAHVSIQEALQCMLSSQTRTWLVEDQGNIVGVLSQARVESALRAGEPEKKLIELLDTLGFPHVHADHPLHLALERMSAAHVDILPVVNRANVHRLEGVVTLRDVLDSYGLDHKRGDASA